MVGCRDVVQNGQAKATLGNVKPMSPPPPVSCELQEKLLSVATMGDMPYLTITEMSVCSWHGSLIRRFGTENLDLTVESGALKHQFLDNSSTYEGPTPLVDNVAICAADS